MGMQGLSTDACGDGNQLQGTAVELFQLAALLVGDEAEAVNLVESTLAAIEIDPCEDPAEAQKVSRELLLQRALVQMESDDPGSFAAAPVTMSGSGCIDDDDLSATGISHEQLSAWLADHGRDDLRRWLRALPGVHRAIFVQRAVLGRGNAVTAASLQGATTGGSGWTPEAVGDAFRQALCSLANTLAHVPGIAIGEPQAASAAHL